MVAKKNKNAQIKSNKQSPIKDGSNRNSIGKKDLFLAFYAVIGVYVAFQLYFDVGRILLMMPIIILFISRIQYAIMKDVSASKRVALCLLFLILSTLFFFYVFFIIESNYYSGCSGMMCGMTEEAFRRLSIEMVIGFVNYGLVFPPMYFLFRSLERNRAKIWAYVSAVFWYVLAVAIVETVAVLLIAAYLLN